MPYADLDLDHWLSLPDNVAGRVAMDIADTVGAQLTEIRLHEYRGARMRLAFFARDDVTYSLVPGGSVMVGYDAGRFTPTPLQLESFQNHNALHGHRYECSPNGLRAFLDAVTTPTRSVSLPALLVESSCSLNVDDYDNDELAVELSERGARLLTPDEWEYACGAGVSTLWRWGDHCPIWLYGSPRDNIMRQDGRCERRTCVTSWNLEYGEDGQILDDGYCRGSDSDASAIWALADEPNRFGLAIGTGFLEGTAQPGVVYGADFGMCSHGNSGSFYYAVSHAQSFCVSGFGDFGNYSYRRVLSLD